MENTVLFLNMFSDYEPPEALRAAFSQAAIVAADIDAPARSVTVQLETEKYIPMRFRAEASKDICEIYGLRKLAINVKNAPSELKNIPNEDLMQFFVAQNSLTRGSLAGAGWVWNGSDLTVQLAANGKKELEEAVPHVQNILKQRFGAVVSIAIEAGQNLQGQALYDHMEKLRSSTVTDLPRSHIAEKKCFRPLFPDQSLPCILSDPSRQS